MTEHALGRDHRTNFDLDSPEFGEHYFDVLDDLVQNCPVAHSPAGHGYYVVTGYDDVRGCAEDWSSFTSTKGFQPNRPQEMMKLIPVEADPPYQQEWRRVLNPYFSPGACAKFEDSIREIVNDVIDGFIESGTTDFVRDFATPLPSMMFFKTLIGVPVEDLDRLNAAVTAGLLGPVDGRAAAWGVCGEYVTHYLRKRMAEPARGDVIDAIIKGFEFEGEEQSFETKVSVVVDLMSGGVGNTAYMLSSIVHHLATHPEDRKTLAADPTKISRAVEEFLRYFSPNVAIGRTCTRDVEVAGTEMKEGDFVMISWATANRDPRMFDNPTKLEIHRERNRHMAFGVGPHRCIGSNLAKVQLRVATQTLLARIPDFDLKPGTEPTWVTGIVREMDNLHLVFPPGRRRS